MGTFSRTPTSAGSFYLLHVCFHGSIIQGEQPQISSVLCQEGEIESHQLPPWRNCLVKHALRANYQARRDMKEVSGARYPDSKSSVKRMYLTLWTVSCKSDGRTVSTSSNPGPACMQLYKNMRVTLLWVYGMEVKMKKTMSIRWRGLFIADKLFFVWNILLIVLLI